MYLILYLVPIVKFYATELWGARRNFEWYLQSQIRIELNLWPWVKGLIHLHSEDSGSSLVGRSQWPV